MSGWSQGSFWSLWRRLQMNAVSDHAWLLLQLVCSFLNALHIGTPVKPAASGCHAGCACMCLRLYCTCFLLAFATVRCCCALGWAVHPCLFHLLVCCCCLGMLKD